MTETSYSEPVSLLLPIGSVFFNDEWIHYPEKYGLGAADVPELIRMATDAALHDASDRSPLFYAPLHAWRALGQLGAAEAVEPLLGLLHLIDDADNEWLAEDMPRVLADIGAPAVPALAQYLADPTKPTWARVAALSTLENIASEQPETRESCTVALTAALEDFEHHDPDLNAEIIASLAVLGVVEAAPLVARAFERDMVNEFVAGDLEDFQVKVGLLEERLTPRQAMLDLDKFHLPKASSVKSVNSKEEKKEKDRRKQEKQSRKMNRKRK